MEILHGTMEILHGTMEILLVFSAPQCYTQLAVSYPHERY